MKTCKVADYNDYNQRLGLFGYGYLHRLLDLLYKLHTLYNIPVNPLVATVFESETGNQIELNGTMYLDVQLRIAKHKFYLKRIWQKRNVNNMKRYSRQLTLF